MNLGSVLIRCGEVIRGFPGGSAVKNLPANAGDETRVWSLDQEDPLEKEMTILTPAFLPRESHGQRSLVVYST